MVAQFLADTLEQAKDPAFGSMQLLSAAGHLSAAADSQGLIDLYRAWLDTHPVDPMRHAIYFNFAVVLSAVNDVEGAKNALTEAIKINPDFIPPYINLGSALERLGAVGEAVQQWYAVVNKLGAISGEAANYKTTALKQIGRVLERYQMDERAEEALNLSLDINPHQSDVIQHWVSLRQRQCKWPVIETRANLTKEHLLKGISALSLAAYTDDPLFQLGNAWHYSKHNIGQPARSLVHTHARLRKTATKRRRIGYMSSDFREHAIGYLTSEIFGLHDRSRTEVFLYYCGHKVTDEVQARIKAQGDHWLDISPLSDDEAADRIAADQIEILIDLNGYTHGARTKLLAMRPAPIIVNWLGFPGTMGSPTHQYVIADDFVIPPGSEHYYSEKVVRIPCYQPNDRRRIVAARGATRAESELPDDAMVYCCFNGAHKITPFTWRRWMTILQNVPGSVLWLLDSIDGTNKRLKKLAAAYGIDPARIIFAKKMRNADHLARYPLADLFLDTSPYGAHTTSSDALWMGVPVLTLVGRSFASRVCGSLVKSAGLPELICYSDDAFLTMAVALGQNKQQLAKLRAKLLANRDTCVLFDSALLVRSLEDAYDQMWQEFIQDQQPRPDLSNLDIYNDIGIELDNNEIEMLPVPNYEQLYQKKLVERHNFSYLRGDSRIWPGDGAIKRTLHLTQLTHDQPLLRDAASAIQGGRFEFAEQLLDSLLKANANNAPALDIAAQLCVMQGRLEQAEEYARRAIAQQPVIPFGLTLAEIMKLRGNTNGAKAFFTSVLQSNPHDVRAAIGMG